MTLTKADIVEKVAKNGFTKRKFATKLETILESIKNSLETREDALISGFGKFCVKEKGKTEMQEPSNQGRFDAVVENGAMRKACSKASKPNCGY